MEANGKEKFVYRRYTFSQISSVEVVENGVTVTQTNRGSQLFGVAVGALLRRSRKLTH
jgi:hypothetical protein